MVNAPRVQDLLEELEIGDGFSIENIYATRLLDIKKTPVRLV